MRGDRARVGARVEGREGRSQVRRYVLGDPIARRQQARRFVAERKRKAKVKARRERLAKEIRAKGNSKPETTEAARIDLPLPYTAHETNDLPLPRWSQRSQGHGNKGARHEPSQPGKRIVIPSAPPLGLADRPLARAAGRAVPAMPHDLRSAGGGNRS